MVIRAKYEDGVFKPLDKVSLKDGTILQIDVPAGERARISIRQFAFTGMWRKRKDISDGLAYVNRLRDERRR